MPLAASYTLEHPIGGKKGTTYTAVQIRKHVHGSLKKNKERYVVWWDGLSPEHFEKEEFAILLQRCHKEVFDATAAERAGGSAAAIAQGPSGAAPTSPRTSTRAETRGG